MNRTITKYKKYVAVPLSR